MEIKCFQLKPRQCFRLHLNNDKFWQITFNLFYSIEEKQMNFQTITQWTPSASTNTETPTQWRKLKQNHASKDDAFKCIFNNVNAKLEEGYQLWEPNPQEQEVIELGKRPKSLKEEELGNTEETEEYGFIKKAKLSQTQEFIIAQDLARNFEEEDYRLDGKSELRQHDETDIAYSNSGMQVEAESPLDQKDSFDWDRLESIPGEPSGDENSESLQSENVEQQIATVILDDDEEEEICDDEPFLEDKLVLALPYNKEDVDGWYFAELVDGIRCFWDGAKLRSSCGTQLHPPKSFTQLLLQRPLDGVLYREKYFLTVNDPVFRKSKQSVNDWNKFRFLVYDAPSVDLSFRERLQGLKQERIFKDSVYFQLAPYEQKDLEEYSNELQKEGGVGFVMKDPDAVYSPGQAQGFFETQFHKSQRNATFIKAKQERNLSLCVQDNETGTGLIVNNDVPDGLDINSLKKGETILYRYKGGCFIRERKEPYFLGVH